MNLKLKTLVNERMAKGSHSEHFRLLAKIKRQVSYLNVKLKLKNVSVCSLFRYVVGFLNPITMRVIQRVLAVFSAARCSFPLNVEAIRGLNRR